ncbi:protein dachsous [Sphaeramia orbicularis]|uniref:protein dachsous n=1 Tax=Sphaeramia orbicularis TaxID=375764 RepID=UPI00117D7F1B|nr:protein dachsous-like [Sphaeramia orbicularis]
MITSGSSVIDCFGGSNKLVGQVDEGYEGDVELVTDIPAGVGVRLAPFIFPDHLEYLELRFTLGDTVATVHTKKTLDADALAARQNTRTLKLIDINDNRPVFTQREYSTRVSEDSGGLNDTATLLITVVDFDNLNPFFIHSQYQAFIPENQDGSFHTIQPEPIKAQDGDTGINMTVTYSISAVTPGKYQSNFHMDPNSGVLSVVSALDREEMSTNAITVNIKAAQTDDSLKTGVAVVTVTIEDVNDNPPEFDKSEYTVQLLENSPVNTVVLKVTVSDRDQGGFVGTLSISPESVPFSIDSDGTVRVKDSAALDRETLDGIAFYILANETAPPYYTTEAYVSVELLDENDNSPVFNRSKYEGKVFPPQEVGMSLVQVKAEDPDAGMNGQITYTIEFGNEDGYFFLHPETGEITLAKIIPLVENSILEFPLYVTATDGGIIPRSTSAQVHIQAPGDSNPQFLQKVFHGTVMEEQDPGVFIIKVQFLSIAPVVPVVLQVVTESDKFEISDSGEMTTKTKLDYDEAPHNYSVSISLSDGMNSDTAIVEVQVTDINDNSPVFESGSVEAWVPEDADVGYNVTDVPATDKDSGFNKEVRYSLRGGEGRFSVDPLTGTVSVAADLDREAKAEYELQVLAEDQGRPVRSATASLLIRLTDVNDNVPEFSKTEYDVEVPEMASVGTSLLTLSATDPDEGLNRIVSYSITQQTPSSDPPVFEVDSSSGILRLVQALDYSKVNEYHLMVQASDGGTPSLTGNSSVVVKVKDVNNNPPVFSKTNYDVAVPENLASGASILTLEVTDRDEVTFYSCYNTFKNRPGGFSNGYFLLDSDTFDINKQGVVSLRKDITLDRETKDSYILQVMAVDQPVDGLNATAQLNITVQDYNDNAPQFLMIPDPLLIAEGQYSEENPGEVFTIRTTDADLGLNGEVTLSLASPHPVFRFREDGMLLAVGPLDRESREMYDLVVKALDKGTPQRENFTTVRVKVTDINDNRPEFSSNRYVSSVLLKDAEDGKLLLTLSATDKDAGNNSVITYSFIAGDSPYLAINSETGKVTLTSDLADVTEDTTLDLTAMAKDNGQPPLNSTARVVVNLRVHSLTEGVAFASPSYNFSVPENEAKGLTVGRVEASAESDLYSVTYKLRTHVDLFSIDAGSGVIVTGSELDREQQEWFILDVEAVDNRVPPMSAIAVVRVQVEDVNEAPHFPSDLYKASIFSIVPYKTPIMHLKASDPDVGDEAHLVYSLTADSPYVDVEPQSGLLYVVSAVGLDGQTVAVDVRATDPQKLYATVKVEVEVLASASSSDIVSITLNQPANVVEKKIPEMQKSLGQVLGWTVNIVDVSSGGAAASRALRQDVKTLVTFFAVDEDEVVSSEEVVNKLDSHSAAVTAELVKVFGEGLQYDLQEEPLSPPSNMGVVIALGVMLGLSIVGLIVTVTLIVRFKRSEKHADSDKESFHISKHSEGYT